MLQPPPWDEIGQVVPHDHPQILNDQCVIRGVSEDHVARNKNPPRLASSLYQTSTCGNSPGMSVDHEPSMLVDVIDLQARYQSGKWIGAVSLNVGFLRGLGFLVGYHPIEGNNYHCEVWGNITGSLSNKIRNCATWFVPIEGVELKR